MFEQPPAQMRPSDVIRTSYTVKIAAGTPFDAVCSPDFWRHHCNYLRAGDRIEVIAEDGSFDADLRVVRVDRLYAKTRVLRVWRDEAAEEMPTGLDASSPTEIDGYIVNHGGRHHGWRVVDPNGEVVMKNFESRSAAEAGLMNYLTAKAA